MSSDAEIVDGIILVMKQFQWSRIGLITQSENIFTFVSAMSIIMFCVFIYTPKYALTDLFFIVTLLYKTDDL